MVPRNTVESRSFVPGTYTVSITSPNLEAPLIEEIEVPGFTDAVVYNVAGAAAVQGTTITFRTTDTDIAPAEQRDYFAGQTFIVRDDVDYVFEVVPDEIEIKTSADSVTRYWLGVDLTQPYGGQPADWGWRAAQRQLQGKGNSLSVEELLGRVSAFDPDTASGGK